MKKVYLDVKMIGSSFSFSQLSFWQECNFFHFNTLLILRLKALYD